MFVFRRTSGLCASLLRVACAFATLSYFGVSDAEAEAAMALDGRRGTAVVTGCPRRSALCVFDRSSPLGGTGRCHIDIDIDNLS